MSDTVSDLAKELGRVSDRDALFVEVTNLRKVNEMQAQEIARLNYALDRA